MTTNPDKSEDGKKPAKAKTVHTPKGPAPDRAPRTFTLGDPEDAPAPKPAKQNPYEHYFEEIHGDGKDAAPADDAGNDNQPGPYDFDPSQFDKEDEDETGEDAAEDEEDDEEYDRVQIALFAIAEKMLPRNPEISAALKHMANIEFSSLVAAGLIEDEMREKLPDAEVDKLIAACLLAEADNFDDIAGEFHADTVALVDAVRAIPPAIDGSQWEFGKLGMDTQRVYLAYMGADIETLAKGMHNGSVLPPDNEDLVLLGQFFADSSHAREKKAGPADNALMKRIAKSFNAVSRALPLDVKLVKDKTGGYTLRDDSPKSPADDNAGPARPGGGKKPRGPRS